MADGVEKSSSTRESSVANKNMAAQRGLKQRTEPPTADVFDSIFFLNEVRKY